jgi:hypothetical protein
MKMPNFNSLLKDKNALYIVFVMAILNILGYLLMSNVDAIVFLLMVGFLTSYFSKNMIVILLVAMVSTNLFVAVRNKGSKEGFGTKRKNDKDDKEDKDGEKEDDKKSDKDETNYKHTGSSDDDSKEDVKGAEEKPKKGSKKGSYVDYAKTLEEAYTQLDKTVGKEGIEGLTKQTGALLEQQTALMSNIKTIEPFLKTAESFMGKLDLEKFGGLDKIMGNLGGLTGAKK